MWKKFNTCYLTGRIRKILQADEDIGEIAMATPILISRAVEIFLQDLCERTGKITLNRDAKVMSSLHLKECVGRHSAFGFLYKIVSHIPDVECDTGGGNAHQRKKCGGDHGEICNDEDAKLAREESEPTTSGEEMGRRGRGRLRRGKGQQDGGQRSNEGWSSEPVLPSLVRSQPKNFDLNVKLDENGEPQPQPQPQPDINAFDIAEASLLPLLYQNSNLFHPEDDYICKDET